MPDIEVADLTIGPARLYYNDVGAALPLDTVPYEGAWPSGWERVGLTSAPLIVAYEYDVVDADAQEYLTAIDRAKSAERARFETALMQVDLELITIAWSGTMSSIGAASGVAGAQVYNVGGRNRLVKRTWGFEGFQYSETTGLELPVRGKIHRATSATGGQLEFGKATWAGTTLQLGALADPSQPRGEQLFTIRRITAAALP